MSYCDRCGGPTSRSSGLCWNCYISLKPKKHPAIHDSTAAVSRQPSIARKQATGTIRVRGNVLGYSSAIAAGDAVMRELVHRLEHNAQHGPVRQIVKYGKRVNNPDAPKAARP